MKAKMMVSGTIAIAAMLFFYGIKKDFIQKDLIPKNNQQTVSQNQNFSNNSKANRRPSSKPPTSVLESKNPKEILTLLGAKNSIIHNHKNGTFKRLDLRLDYSNNGLAPTINQLSTRVLPLLNLQKQSSFQIRNADSSSVYLDHYFGGLKVKNSSIEIQFASEKTLILSILNRTKIVDPNLLAKEIKSSIEARKKISSLIGSRQDQIRELTGPYIEQSPTNGAWTVVWTFKRGKSSQTLKFNALSEKLIR